MCGTTIILKEIAGMIMCTFQTLKINMIILFAKGVLASFEGISFEGIFTDNFLSALLLKPFQSQMERQRLAPTFESVDSTVVIKSHGPGISPGYYECGPWVLLLKNRRKMEPNEIHSCLIPCLLSSISYLEHCTLYNMGLCY